MSAAPLLPDTSLPDPAALLGPVAGATSLGAVALLLVVHAAISLAVALTGVARLPALLREPRWAVVTLLWNFAFIAPVLGPVAIVLITRRSRYQAHRAARRARPASVVLPEYDVQAGDHAVRNSQGDIRSRLDPQVPGTIRMQSLLTLQAVPGRVANPILESLLGDDSDDVRLLAFGMLDSGEKHISRAIQHERAQLESELSAAQRFDCLRHLAELHWELVYAGLAQGELRRHILRQARDYIDQALATGEVPTPGLLLLQGRVMLEQNDYDEAEQALHRAIDRGLPPVSALPYLAEIAYARRDFDHVRTCMAQMTALNTAAKTTAIVDLWTGRETVSKLGEHNFLPHI
jgi:tetratricopeptide (TPR) repeat protein